MADTRRSLSSLQTLLADNTSGDISAQDARDELISSHPEKTCQSDTLANEPSSGQLAGDAYEYTDAPWRGRWDGSAWQIFGPRWKLKRPVLGDYTANNSASGNATHGGIYLSDSSAGAAYQVRSYTKSAPATPWTFTALVSGQHDAAGFFNAGLCFRQSSDGKMVTFGPWWNVAGTTQFHIDNMTSATSQSSRPLSVTAFDGSPGGAPFWMRVADNGTNRLCQMSADGWNWLTVYSVSRTTFLTADQLGFFVNPYTSAGGIFLHSLEVG